jgi:hypothetical protein
MPEYRFKGEYTVHCLRGGGPFPRGPALRVEGGCLADLASVHAATAGNVNLSPADVRLPGLGDDDVYLLRDRQGEVEAACAVWNQQSHKQYVVTGYSGGYRWLRRLPTRLFGYPDLPRPNTVVNCASITLLAVRGNDSDLARYFVRSVAATASRHAILMLGVFANHPLRAAMNGLRSIRYGSRL